MEVSVKYHSGEDVSVVNAARVSFGKEKEVMDLSDKKLISFLAREGHWSPFAHTSITFHVKAPIFVARQLAKHQVGFSWNEISRRYVDAEPELYNPMSWRLRAKNVKQGSSNETLELDIKEYNDSCIKFYNDLLEKNIAPEMARMVLPMNMMTEWVWTGSLYGFARVCKLRLAKDSQAETRCVAKMIDDECEKLFPVSWRALRKYNFDSHEEQEKKSD